MNLLRRYNTPHHRKLALFLPLLLVVAFLGTPLIYYLPKTILPPIRPDMSWKQVFDHLLARGSTGGVNWLREAAVIWKARDYVFWATQTPFLAMLLIWGVYFFRGNDDRLRAAPNATHGSSRWRKPSEYSTTLTKVSCDTPESAGLVVGADGKSAWVTNPNAGSPHALLFGATRSGKSRRVIIPSIYTLGSNKESMIITDPKGELHAYTAQWLESQGYEVVQLNLYEPTRGHRWNPLSRVSTHLAQGNTAAASQEAWEIGHILTHSDGAGSDPIWPQAEESLISALSLAVTSERDDQLPPEARHMTSVLRILSELGADGGEALDAYIRKFPGDHPVRMAYTTAGLSESRTRSSIYTGTAARLRLWGDQGIAWLCSASDFDPADAGRRPMAIFVIIPDEAGARRNIAALFVNQTYSALVAVARRHGGRLPVNVWFLLDEFGNIGKLPALDEKLTVSAGRGIRWVLAVQAKSQLQHIYGRDIAETVVANCDTWLYLRTSALETAKEISAKVGTYTVVTHSKQYRTGRDSISESATGRALLTPDEILRWQLGQSLVLQAGQFPAKLELQDMSQWSKLSSVFVMANNTAEAPMRPPVITWVPNRKRETPTPQEPPIHKKIDDIF